jgi:hypothetical protein
MAIPASLLIAITCCALAGMLVFFAVERRSQGRRT